MNPKHFLRSFVWSNKILHNYFKESQKITKSKNPRRASSSFSIITFDDFHIFEKKLHFIRTVLCVLSRRLLILRARHSFKVTMRVEVITRAKLVVGKRGHGEIAGGMKRGCGEISGSGEARVRGGLRGKRRKEGRGEIAGK